jgi:hypothetical protein
MQWIHSLERKSKTSLFSLNNPSKPAIGATMGTRSDLGMRHQNYKERDGETANSLCNVSTAAA